MPVFASVGERSAMNEPMIRFPVRCPQCGSEALTAFPVATVANALIQRNRIRLHTDCHGIAWYANNTEMEQIREYLGAPWLDAQRVDQAFRRPPSRDF
jgi:hypothetical protein